MTIEEEKTTGNSVKEAKKRGASHWRNLSSQKTGSA
jgi:hypothetical protein